MEKTEAKNTKASLVLRMILGAFFLIASVYGIIYCHFVLSPYLESLQFSNMGPGPSVSDLTIYVLRVFPVLILYGILTFLTIRMVDHLKSIIFPLATYTLANLFTHFLMASVGQNFTLNAVILFTFYVGIAYVGTIAAFIIGLRLDIKKYKEIKESKVLEGK